MKASELEKKFSLIAEELSASAQREADREKTQNPRRATVANAAKKENDTWTSGLSRMIDNFGKQAEKFEKETAAAAKANTQENKDKLDKGEGEFAKLGDKTQDELSSYIGWVRGKLMKEDLSPEFLREAGATDDLRKYEGELDKYVSGQLKRAGRISKPAEVIPSKFEADMDKVIKELKSKVEGKVGLEVCLREIKDSGISAALKKCDSNHEFERVTPLCTAAIHEVNKVAKVVKSKEAKDILGKFAKDIDRYDEHMFLLSKAK